eukprot:12927306-Alexandrium_andersonii.AAC.1
MGCHDTNSQQVQRLEQPTSKAACRCFNSSWIAHFGAPEVVVCNGGPEFMKNFTDGAEMWGIMMHGCSSESPRENGRAERHGDWVKDKVESELQATGGVVRSQQDPD